MRVIKVGGSIEKQGQLDKCLSNIQKLANQATVITPGGGAFADQVRLAQHQWGVNDRIAHQMAILAMAQMALLIHGLRPDWQVSSNLQELAKTQQISIWYPKISLLDEYQIPANWNITSDSLSAWLATQLQAKELWIIKSATFPHSSTISDLIHSGILDSAFLDYYSPQCASLQIVNLAQFLAN